MNGKGKIFLIPTPLGDTEPLEVLPISVKKNLEHINRLLVENEKSARRFVKKILPGKKQSALQIGILDKYTPRDEIYRMLQPCLDGEDIAVLSEAGLPAVADPGAALVREAHLLGIRVVPLTGPSSIFLALMASGMNGQRFAFHGYLPIESVSRRKAIKELERKSAADDSTQICIETPYRNEKLLEAFLKTLRAGTLLCVAVDLTLPTEQILTAPVSRWKNMNIALHKRPAIFLIYREPHS